MRACWVQFIAEMRSFVYYDMGLLMGAAQDYHAATKATDKARSNLKKKQDAAAKPGERGTKASALVYAPYTLFSLSSHTSLLLTSPYWSVVRSRQILSSFLSRRACHSSLNNRARTS